MMPINIGTKILLFCEAIVSSESSNMTPRVYPGRSDLGRGHLHDDILTGWTAQYVPWASTNAHRLPISPCLPQVAHSNMATVISTSNSACIKPAMALPSNIRHADSSIHLLSMVRILHGTPVGPKRSVRICFAGMPSDTNPFATSSTSAVGPQI